MIPGFSCDGAAAAYAYMIKDYIFRMSSVEIAAVCVPLGFGLLATHLLHATSSNPSAIAPCTIDSLDTHALNGLRGVAALHIFLYHYLRMIWVAPLGQIWSFDTYGEVELSLFYLLSGFVLTLNFRRAVPYAAFVVKRVARLAPLYYCSNALVLLWHVLRYGSLDDYYFTRQGKINCCLSVVGLTSLLPNLGPPNQPAWTVSVFFCFYLAYPPLANRLLGLSTHSASRLRALATTLFASYALALVFAFRLYGFSAVYCWAPLQLLPFAAGAIAALERAAVPSGGKEQARFGNADVIAVVYLLGVAGVAIARDRSPLEHFYPITILGFAMMLPLQYHLVCALVPSKSVAHQQQALVIRLLCAAPMQRLGSISFALYLWQVPIGLMTVLGFDWAGWAMKGGEGDLVTIGFNGQIVRFLTASALTFGAACASGPLLEKPVARAIFAAHERWFQAPVDPKPSLPSGTHA